MKDKLITAIIILIIAILLGLLSGYAVNKYNNFQSKAEQSTIQLDATAPTLEPLR